MVVHPDGSPVEYVCVRSRQLAQDGCVVSQLPTYDAELHLAVLRQWLAHASTDFSLELSVSNLASCCPSFAHTMQTRPVVIFVVGVGVVVIVATHSGESLESPLPEECVL